MSENQDQINLLISKLNEVLKQQESFTKEISQLKQEISVLKGIKGVSTSAVPPDRTASSSTVISKSAPPKASTKPISKPPQKEKAPRKKSDLEKFIGENLINKIGIGITVIGVGIGAKYAIDHEMVSPLTRIILGYLVGIGLLGFAFKLKAKYTNFSAVLLSGAMAIMYFITYMAYGYYDLFPQLFAFALMVIFTAFTVTAAINYNNVVIANIGLVGAYAVPFLLSDGTGKVEMLFSYMGLINAGILIIALKKYWKSLYYASFGFTWVIYLGWLGARFDVDEHQMMALSFATVFYLIFYASFISYKLINQQQFTGATIWLLLANSFIFYGVGYYIIAELDGGNQFLGIFTLGNAFIHFIVGLIINQKKLADKSVLYLIIGLVLTFLTIAIPVQLDGNWVTMLWGLEAVLLFSIGRIKSQKTYELLSYPLMIIAFFSLTHDWIEQIGYYDPLDPETRLTPVFNIHFLTTLMVALSFGAINYLRSMKNWESPITHKQLNNIFAFLSPALLIVTSFFLFKNEISLYWNQLIEDSGVVAVNAVLENTYDRNWDLEEFQTVWISNYLLIFLSALAVINWLKVKSKMLGTIVMILSTFALLSFLTSGLYAISELRESFLDDSLLFSTGPFHVGIRYISLVILVGSIWVFRKHSLQDYMQMDLTILNDLVLYITFLWVSSSELIHWLDMAGYSESYKLGLSILWGVYALTLVAIGIWKRQKHIRIIAMVWFGITLLKLFFYDIRHLNTISKTIVFVSLGVFLLIISFLYNKYKEQIGGNEKA